MSIPACNYSDGEKEEFRRRRKAARQKYKPDHIKILLIAEAPPKELKRYYYFEQSYHPDSLFIETMNALYHTDRFDTTYLRTNKASFLNCFIGDGFYLIDACEDPMECTSSSYKRNKIKAELPALHKEVSAIVNDETKIILISSSVYRTCESSLAEFNVVNEGAIPFPGSGHQRQYRRLMMLQLQKIGWARGRCYP